MNNSTEDNNSQLKKENEIIEQIISNPLLVKDIDNLQKIKRIKIVFSEKDKIKDVNFDNKLSFKVQDKNEEIENNNNNNSNKNIINNKKDIIDNLIIELFEYHYKEISSEKKAYLSNKFLETKNYIEFFCTKLNNNFSKYILLLLEQKIYELIEYIEEEIIKKNVICFIDILKK